MSDMLIDIQYDPEQNNYIYSFRMSEQKKHDLEKRLQSYGAALEEAIPNYLQAVMNREVKNTYCGHYHTIKKIDKIQFMYNDFDEFPENEDDEIDDEDVLCYECSLYGDNSYLDENGEWVNCCPECPLNRMNDD